MALDEGDEDHRRVLQHLSSEGRGERIGRPGSLRAVPSELQQAFTSLVPHNQALGLELCDFANEARGGLEGEASSGVAVMRLPYKAELVGNPETGVLHGGAITALLDATAGAAVFVALWSTTPIATLDLRIDYLKPATPGRDVFARCTCYKLTRNVAFARGTAYHDDESDPIACATGTFMLATRGSFAKLGRLEPT